MKRKFKHQSPSTNSFGKYDPLLYRFLSTFWKLLSLLLYRSINCHRPFICEHTPYSLTQLDTRWHPTLQQTLQISLLPALLLSRLYQDSFHHVSFIVFRSFQQYHTTNNQLLQLPLLLFCAIFTSSWSLSTLCFLCFFHFSCILRIFCPLSSFHFLWCTWWWLFYNFPYLLSFLHTITNSIILDILSLSHSVSVRNKSAFLFSDSCLFMIRNF